MVFGTNASVLMFVISALILDLSVIFLVKSSVVNNVPTVLNIFMIFSYSLLRPRPFEKNRFWGGVPSSKVTCVVLLYVPSVLYTGKMGGDVTTAAVTPP